MDAPNPFDGLAAIEILNPLERAIGAALVRAQEKRPDIGALALVHVVEDALIAFMEADGVPQLAHDDEGDRCALDCLKGRAWIYYTALRHRGHRPHEALHQALASARSFNCKVRENLLAIESKNAGGAA